jgi:hypothetical protein
MPAQSLDPAAFVREHHVHYGVEREEVVGGQERQTVGFDVRLYASHDGSKLGTPGCEECVALIERLRAFAEQLVERVPAPIQLVAEPSTLYESSEDRGRDEVSLTIRVGPLDPGAREDDPALASLREHLEALGVPRRS